MIIGKDKERVRKLEIEAELSKELIEDLKNDLEKIGNDLKKIGDTLESGDLLKSICYLHKMIIFNDVGRCQGHLDYFK